MRKITLLLGLMLCSILAVQAQTLTPNVSRTAQNPAAEAALMADILDRYEALGSQAIAFPGDMFTEREMQMLRSHLSNQVSNNRMATLLTEDFVDITTLPGAGYSFVNVSDAPGATDWLQGNPAVFPAQAGGASEYIGANFNNTGGSIINNFMITPPLDLENGDEIIFWSRSTETTPGFDFPDRLEVRIDPTGADTDPANATDVGSYTELLLEINPTLASMGYPEVWTQFTATVSGLTGTVNTRVAFRYWVTNAGPLGVNSDFIGIDTLTIEEGGGGPPPPAMDRVFAFDAGFCSDDMGTFDVAGPYTINAVATSATAIFSGDYDGTGTLYAMDNDALTLITVDTATGAETTVGPLTNIVPGDGTRGLAWDASTSTMYLMSGAGADYTIYTVDLATGTLTVVGTNTSVGGLPIWLAIDNDGNAFMADIGDDNFYSVNLTDGTSALIGALGFNLNFAQDADFDPDTNTLYMGAYLGGGANEWASIDVTTGAATSLGQVNANCAELGIVAIEGTPVVITNDECVNATAMACGDIEMGDTTTNTDTGGANDSLDAWYSYTGTGAAEFVTFSLCDGTATHDTLLTVFDSCGGAVVAGNDDSCGLQSEVSFLSDGTTTYFVAVEGFNNAEAGPFAIEVSCNPVAANDLCDDAVAISCGDVIAGSTSFATIDDSVASSCDNQGTGPDPVEVTAPGVWYTYTETIPGFIQDINLSVCDDADFDTKISVYTGDCGTLTCVAADDDDPDCAGFTSTVDFQSDGISTYYILVHGFGTQTGDFNLTMTCSPLAPPNDMIVNSIDVDEAGLPYTDPAVNMPGATIEAGGTPADCDNAGVRGVWYNFVAEMGGTATASVTTPAAYTSVTFYTAPDEEAVETDLVLVDYFDNQCLPGTDASILVTAGQAYYVYVANQGGVTDIVIDGDFYLGIGDTTIQGFTYFPNPAADQLNLRSGNGTIESAIIYNILGQEVLSEKVGSSDAQLNVANLSVGTYILKVVVDGELGIYKIVKQ